MRTQRRFLLAFGALGAAGLALSAANCGGGGNTNPGGGGYGTSHTGSGGTTGTGGSGGVIITTNPDAGACQGDSECDGGVCVSGTCCDSAAHVCGGACCTGGTVCLFDKCVTPGAHCHTANDCGSGKYCETALGDPPGDGGAPDGGGDGGPTCTAPLPLEGRCLDLPPVCDSTGNPPGCVPSCEYHPPAGNLNAVEKWEWGTAAVHRPGYVDVWTTPAVGRIYDGNCDGKVDELDSPSIIFVSGRGIDASTGKGTCCQCTNETPTSCHTGVLRVLDGRTGAEVWSLDNDTATPNTNAAPGFAGTAVAIGDIDGDGRMDIIAATGDGFVVMVDSTGHVVRKSDKPIPGAAANAAFGWGGGLAIADMDGDGFPEIAFGNTVFKTTGGAITLAWSGTGGLGGGGVNVALSTFVDLDGAADNHLELLAGNTAYKADGTVLWNRADLPDGFPGVGDFNLDGKPEVALVSNGKLWILDGATGVTLLGPATLPGTGSGGPPTVADFDGDKKPEIGVAMATFYSVMKPNFAANTIDVLWKTANHDLSSSVTGSTVFDFEGDGKAEVIYGDECFLWVFDGTTGAVRFAAPHSSFTGTEASLVADVDGDGRAEMVMITNSADPAQWGCLDANNNPVTVNGVTWTPGPQLGKSYRGLKVFGDKASSWVGTRTLWSQHTYHVTNICDARDSACDAPNTYGAIPKLEKKNWTLPWLNDFRQNVQDKGLFDAPDAVVTLSAECKTPVVFHAQVRNMGLASLPAGVAVGVFKRVGATDIQVGTATTSHALFPGQTEELVIAGDAQATITDTFVAKILVDPNAPTFHECREDNDESDPTSPHCVQ
jgi:hypothetical protein